MSEKRIGFLDTWRAAALLAMIVWHFLFDLASVGLVPDLLMQSGVMELARYMIAGSFIAISGVCARLSKRPLRRGLIVLAAALLVSVVTYLIGAPVYWGILHLLGVCMLLYAAARRRWEALPEIYACGAALLVFALTFVLPIRVRVCRSFFRSGCARRRSPRRIIIRCCRGARSFSPRLRQERGSAICRRRRSTQARRALLRG